jgi:hypothetical protein
MNNEGGEGRREKSLADETKVTKWFRFGNGVIGSLFAVGP